MQRQHGYHYVGLPDYCRSLSRSCKPSAYAAQSDRTSWPLIDFFWIYSVSTVIQWADGQKQTSDDGDLESRRQRGREKTDRGRVASRGKEIWQLQRLLRAEGESKSRRRERERDWQRETEGTIEEETSEFAEI